MKAKLRKIKVDDQTFLWRIVRVSQASVCLRVWIDGRKMPWLEVICRFDDPWLSFPESASLDSASANSLQFEPLRPKQIAEIIRQVVERCQSTGQSMAHRYALARDGHLIEVVEEPVGCGE
jgi:hypothetical protein